MVPRRQWPEDRRDRIIEANLVSLLVVFGGNSEAPVYGGGLGHGVPVDMVGR